jgi:hypothetical protein
VVLAMTTQAASHVVLYQRLRGGGLCHVTVTADALDSRANMWRVLKFDQGSGIETIDPHPWNLAPCGGKLRNFLDFRIVGRNFGMAQHAFGYRWDGRARAGVGSAVTIQALQSVFDVYFMRVGNRLFGAHHARGHRNHEQQNPELRRLAFAR